MATGNFRLYYKDKAGLEVPLKDVKYRIMQLPAHTEIINGITNEYGLTKVIDGTFLVPNGTKYGLPAYGAATSPEYRPAPLTQREVAEFQLQIWDYEIKQYVAPDLHAAQGPSDLEVQLGMTFEMVERKLRLRPYVRIWFFMKAGNKGIANAPYLGYQADDKGRIVAAKDISGKAVKGNTEKNGKTKRIETENPMMFQFDLPGTKISQKTKLLTPVVRGQPIYLYQLGMKSQQATTAPKEGRTAVVNGKTSIPAVINAEKDELLLLTPKVWEEFEAFSGHIESTMASVHRSRLNLSNALAARSPEQIKQAEIDLGLAEDNVGTMLNGDFGKLADLQEVVTFESYNKGKGGGPGGEDDAMGLRRRYIPKKKYDELKERRVKGVPYKLEMGVSAKGKDGDNSAGVSANHKPGEGKNFDREKFTESLKEIAVQSKKFEWASDPKVINLLEVGGNQFSDTVQKSDSFEIEKSAQWLRFVGGAGASAEANWDPTKGEVGAKLEGNLQGKLILFEAKYTFSYAVPSVNGWQMTYSGMDLGAIVFVLACDLYGFAGAKGALTGCVGISMDGGKAKVTAEKRDRTDSLAKNFDTKAGIPRADLGGAKKAKKKDGKLFVPAGLNETPPEGINGVEIKAEIFAGIEGGLTPSGELRWLPPDRPNSDPVSFAKLSLDLAANAGAGATAQLNIFYAMGKFRIKASARLCWGIGAKGAIDFVVDAEGMKEFVEWIYYQLAHSGFITLAYMADRAFEALAQIVFMVIAEDSNIGNLLYANTQEVRAVFDDLIARLEKSEARNKMVMGVNKKPHWLLHAAPETRGMLLYAITRHYPESHSYDVPLATHKGMDPQVHFLNDHKQAILNIMATVSLRSEWSNVMQHMTIDGSKRSDAGKAEGDLLRFLNYGWSLNDNLNKVFDNLNAHPEWKSSDVGNTYLEEYLEHRSELNAKFPKGYKIAQFGSPEYDTLMALDGQQSQMFAMIAPQNEWLDQPLIRDDETRYA